MATIIQSRYDPAKMEMMEAVFQKIVENSGQIRSADLDRIFENKREVRVAITRLTVLGRIARRRGLAPNGVEYFYHNTSSQSFEKYHKMELRAFH